MQIRFHGAVNGHVTGSCTEFYYKRTNTRFLVDCGMVQGEAHAQADNARDFPFKASDIKFVLLTHAHLDHCGLLPKLFKDGFRGKVLCTRATAEETRVILLDSAGLPDSPYDKEDVALVQFEAVDERPDFGLSRPIPIDDDLFAGFMRSAHLVGSVSISLTWLDPNDQKRNIVMSGDLGTNTKANPCQSLLAGRQEIFGYPDYIVLESTYGDRERETCFADRDARLKALGAIVRESLVERVGPLVIPAFSLHRTQEILFDLFCLYGREGFHLPLTAALMSEYTFEKFIGGEILLQSDWHSQLTGIIKTQGTQDDQEIIQYFKTTTATNGSIRYSLGNLPDHMKVKLRQFATMVPVAQPLVVHLESPLARKISGIYRQWLKTRQIKKPLETLYRNRKLPEWLGVATEEDVDEVFDLLFGYAAGPEKGGTRRVGGLSLHFGDKFTMVETGANKPTVVISSGGMCEGGPIVNLLPVALKSEAVTFAATGYMAKGSTGAKIVSLLSQPPGERGGKLQFMVQEMEGKKTVGREVEVDGKDVRARLADMRGYYSGHADLNGLCDFVLNVTKSDRIEARTKPARVFLNHGGDGARVKLKREIEGRAGKNGAREVSSVELADGDGRWFDLEKGEYLESEEGLEAKVNRLLKDNIEIKAMLKAVQVRMGLTVERCMRTDRLPFDPALAGDSLDSFTVEEADGKAGEVVTCTDTLASGLLEPETLLFNVNADPISDAALVYIDVKRST